MNETPIENMNVWSTPLFVAQLGDHDFLREAILEQVYQAKSQQAAPIESQIALSAKHALHESTLDFLDLAEANVMELKRQLEETTLAVVGELNQAYWPADIQVNAEIIESWYHVTQKGGYHDVHSHPNCSWCGIYYLAPGDHNAGGVNRFYDPRHNAEHFADLGTAYLGGQGVWDFTPQEGQVIIFPSYLKHSALPYFGSQDRVVIAFNCVIDGYIE